ncbi:MAG: hypothetical protein QOH55_2152 [Microbacteriaceae bacterium]|nr:hypothetical protein [Microbacteriaceae bacterium]
MREFTRWMLIPVMRAWAAAMTRELEGLPRPLDVPRARSGGIDSDRILIFGGGPAAGAGVLSHDLALPGSLARALTARTRRGAHVDVVPVPRMTIGSALAELEGLDLKRYDAIVVTLGANDARNLTSIDLWRRKLSAVLGMLSDDSVTTAQIFVVGIHPIRAIPAFNYMLGSVADRHGRALNRVTAELCATLPRITYVPLPAPPHPSPGRFRTARDYQSWAELLANRMIPPLESRRLAAGERDAEPTTPQIEWRESDRQRAVDWLGFISSDPEHRFDRIVTLAQRAFGTRAAAFIVTDRNRQWNMASVGLKPKELPRVSAFTTVTLRAPGPLVVSDARTNAKFSHHPLVRGEPHIRFYAGFPVESPSGERIGALCVFDPEPRSEADVDRELLRELALMVERELKDRPKRLR